MGWNHDNQHFIQLLSYQLSATSCSIRDLALLIIDALIWIFVIMNVLKLKSLWATSVASSLRRFALLGAKQIGNTLWSCIKRGLVLN